MVVLRDRTAAYSPKKQHPFCSPSSAHVPRQGSELPTSQSPDEMQSERRRIRCRQCPKYSHKSRLGFRYSSTDPKPPYLVPSFDPSQASVGNSCGQPLTCPASAMLLAPLSLNQAVPPLALCVPVRPQSLFRILGSLVQAPDGPYLVLFPENTVCGAAVIHVL